jgi:glucokinase
MKKQLAIGVDIGGSHIVSAAVDIENLEIIPNTTHSVKVDNKLSKDEVIKTWSKAITRTIESVSLEGQINIGFAMPGPFHYKTGLAMYKGSNEKYENLYNVSIPKELSKHLNYPNLDFRFLNDATSFGVGVASIGKAENYDKVIAVTLGTGFGSAFIDKGVPQVKREDVPVGGCLWDKPYKGGIGDDYFSTRWCVKRFYELTGVKLGGVRDIAEKDDENSKTVFKEFGANMAEFMLPFIRNYQPDLIILGGNVSKASDFFLPTMKNQLNKVGIDVSFKVSGLMEEAAIIGSARLYDPLFWDQVKEDLPEL